MASISTTLGRGIARIAATTVHAGAVTWHATGRAGNDFAEGYTDGYAEHSARLQAIRAGMPAQKFNINVVRPPARRAPVKA